MSDNYACIILDAAGNCRSVATSIRKDDAGATDVPANTDFEAHDEDLSMDDEQDLPHGAETGQKLIELAEENIPLMDDEMGKELLTRFMEEYKNYLESKYPDVDFGGETEEQAKSKGGEPGENDEEDPLAPYRRPQPEATGSPTKGGKAGKTKTKKTAKVVKAYFGKRHHGVFSDAADHMKVMSEIDPGEFGEKHKTYQAACAAHATKMETALKELGGEPHLQTPDPDAADARADPSKPGEIDKEDETDTGEEGKTSAGKSKIDDAEKEGKEEMKPEEKAILLRFEEADKQHKKDREQATRELHLASIAATGQKPAGYGG